jgi:hypothetical protein
MDSLTKTLPDGRSVHVTPLITAFGAVSYTVTDEHGRLVTDGWLQDAEKRGADPEARPAGHTHLIPGLTPVWFTPEEAEQLAAVGRAALKAFQASEEGQELARWRHGREEENRATVTATEVLRTPEGRKLLARRESLLNDIRAMGDTESTERAAAHDTGDPGFYYRERKPRLEAAIERAHAELDAFDRDHPEIAAALKVQRDVAARRAAEL